MRGRSCRCARCAAPRRAWARTTTLAVAVLVLEPLHGGGGPAAGEHPTSIPPPCVMRAHRRRRCRPLSCMHPLQGLGVALKCGATKAQFDSCVGIHPSAAEEWVTMSTAARLVGGWMVLRGVAGGAWGAGVPVTLMCILGVGAWSRRGWCRQPHRRTCLLACYCLPCPARRVACTGKFVEPAGAECAGYKN